MRNFFLALLLVGITAVWGWTFVVVKDATEAYGVVSFLAVRFTIGTAILAGAAAMRWCWKSVLIGSGIGIVLASAYLLQTFGLQYTTPTNCGLITGLFAVFALVINRLLFGVRTGTVFWAAIAVSLVGLAMLAGLGPNRLALGDFLTLAGAACFGLHIALLDRYAKHHDATVLAWSQMAFASIIYWAICPMTETFAWPTGKVWFALLITGVIATAAGFLIQTHAQQRLPAVRTAVIISLEPLFAALFGFLLAGDQLTGLQIFGAALMIGAVVLAEVRSAVVENGRNSEESAA